MVRDPDRSLGDRLRARGIGPFRDGAFKSALHTEPVAAVLGVALGVTFTICFSRDFCRISFSIRPKDSCGRHAPPASTASPKVSMS
jgi:hypothetical protein